MVLISVCKKCPELETLASIQEMIRQKDFQSNSPELLGSISDIVTKELLIMFYKA